MSLDGHARSWLTTWDRAREGVKFPKVPTALRRLQGPLDARLCEFEVTVAVRTIKVVPKKLRGALRTPYTDRRARICTIHGRVLRT